MQLPKLDENWPRFIAGSGLALLLTLVGEVVVVFGSGPAPQAFYIGIVTSVPFILGFLYAGYWLATGPVTPDRYGRVGRTWIAGMVAAVLIVFPINATIRPITAKMVVGTVRWTAAIGGCIGLMIGIFRALVDAYREKAEAHRRRLQQLERERDRLDRFATLIADDLRGPLQIVRSQVAHEHETGYLTGVEEITEALEQMDAVIEQAVIMARGGSASTELEPIDLGMVCIEWRQSREIESVTITIDDSPTIYAYPNAMANLLENVFRNAVHRGGKPVSMRVGSLSDKEGIYVADDAHRKPQLGTDASKQSHISDATDCNIPGIVIQKIVDDHEWELTITTSRDGGARFEFRGVELAG